jgi:peptidoglycan DL-endopeptidase LytE
MASLLVPQLYSKSTSKTDNIGPESAAADSALKNAQEPAVYVVKKGDSLYSIANSQGTTIKALKAANHLKTSRLQIGQKLSIPAAPGLEKAATASVSPHVRETGAAESQLPDSNAIHSTQDGATDAGEMDAEANSGAAQETNADDQEVDLSSQPLRYRLASAGLEWLGVRYRRSGSSEEKGFDCSGLVKRLFGKFQIGLPRSSREQFQEGVKVANDELEVGDLVFFSSKGKVPNHVGIYIGDNMFIHAALRAKQVMISNLTSPWYKKRFLGARRLLDLWQDETHPDDQTSK